MRWPVGIARSAGTYRLRRTAAALAAVAAITFGGTLIASAQSTTYPTKPSRIFVPYGPGGVGDLTMRLVADKLGQSLKQPFIVENRPGAGGIAAMRAVLEAPADGYSLCIMGNGQAISKTLRSESTRLNSSHA